MLCILKEKENIILTITLLVIFKIIIIIEAYSNTDRFLPYHGTETNIE